MSALGKDRPAFLGAIPVVIEAKVTYSRIRNSLCVDPTWWTSSKLNLIVAAHAGFQGFETWRPIDTVTPKAVEVQVLSIPGHNVKHLF